MWLECEMKIHERAILLDCIITFDMCSEQRRNTKNKELINFLKFYFLN